MEADTIKAMFLLFVRQVVLMASGSLVAHNVVPADFFSTSDATIYSAGIVALAILGWQAWQKRRAAVVAEAAKVSGVAAILTNDRALADAVPSDKVQPK